MLLRRRDPLERFMSHVHRDDSGCWFWTGACATNGYGRFMSDSPRCVQAHRWAYEHFVGPIPDGLVLDHLCHNQDETCEGGYTCSHRRCVNPAHLEAVSNRVNVKRGRAVPPDAAARRSQRFCKRGHLLEGENLYLRSDGRRRCRTCSRMHVKAYSKTEKGRAALQKAQATRRAQQHQSD